ALVREAVPAERRMSRYGLVAAAIALGAAAGPAIGGILAGIAGWRAVFFVCVPVVLTALVLGWPSIPAPASVPGPAAGSPDRGQPRRGDPLRWPQLFRAPAFAAASGAVALSNLAMYSTLLAVP